VDDQKGYRQRPLDWEALVVRLACLVALAAVVGITTCVGWIS
jgi:hypothetical protein